MPTTVGNFSAIDDTEVDAESPITETLMTRLRDNSYWIKEGTNKTDELTTGLYLEPDGSGGVRWTAPYVVNGSKGTVSSITTTWATLTTETSGILFIHYASGGGGLSYEGSITIDLSDDTFVSVDNNGGGGATQQVASGTITTGSSTGEIYYVSSTDYLYFRRNSGNLQYASANGGGGGGGTAAFTWIII